MEELHQITAAEAISDSHVRVSFDTGEVAIFDCSPYMKENYWSSLRQPAYFRQVTLDHGVLTWPNGVDIAPEDVWEDAIRQ